MDWRDIKEFIKDTIGYIIFIAIIFFLAIYVVGLQQVVGDSMNPNFIHEDILILDKITYRFKDVQREDVIALYAESEGTYLIKRVIGLPGEKIDFVDNTLYINDVAYEEKYLGDEIVTDDFSLSELGYEKIPEGKYLVLGDNRQNSKDSRSPKIGLIDKEDIKGKVRFRIFPLDSVEVYK